MLSVEKAWLLSQIGLVPDCDDNVIWDTIIPWSPPRGFIRQEQERERTEAGEKSGEQRVDGHPYLPLPSIPYVGLVDAGCRVRSSLTLIAIDVSTLSDRSPRG